MNVPDVSRRNAATKVLLETHLLPVLGSANVAAEENASESPLKGLWWFH
jgi:hypothetical protein